MEDTTTPVATQADATSESTPAQAAINTPEPQAGGGQEHISLEEARKLRSEAANLRKRLKSYEDAEQQARDAQLSEVERIKKQHAELQSQHDTYVRQAQERIVRYEVQAQATKLNIIDPEAAAMLLNWSELEFDDDGMPTNAAKLLEKLIKNKPYLAPAQTAQEEKPATPAQTAQQQRAPQVPAMNPGRASIAQPNTIPQGTPIRLADVWRRQ